jgi:formylglycine-generating enzyme required for sulfatase activity
MDMIEMMYIPAGRFKMGSENGEPNEKPVHWVEISKPFLMGKYKVTQEQWKAVMGTNPSYFQGARLPVESVSWFECQQFIRQLNAKEGGGYRLPTEAEWEYACRAGTTEDYAGDLDLMGWYGNNSGRSYLDAANIWETDSDNYYKWLLANGCQTYPVGEKQPNGWGLYDMDGTVWEWCSDWYGAYTSGDSRDPSGPSRGSYRVSRGGCWMNLARYCRSATRNWNVPGYRYVNLGFRLVRTAL